MCSSFHWLLKDPESGFYSLLTNIDDPCGMYATYNTNDDIIYFKHLLYPIFDYFS